MSYENYKCGKKELIDKHAIIFVKNHNDISDNCDKKKMKT